MSSHYRIDASRITPVLTSCGRFDLLQQTISSFAGQFDAPRILVSEDSTDAAGAAAFARANPIADMRVHPEKFGQMRSIDALYAEVETPYVLHLEDDWNFTAGVDLDAVVSFLEAHDDVSVVCIAYRFDKRFARHVTRTSHAGLEFLLWDLDTHPKWFSYSFNPSVGRLSLWRELGSFTSFGTEENVSAACKARGLRIAYVVPSIGHHIGDDRHAHDPFQPKRATTILGRLKRSIAKRLPKAETTRHVEHR